MGILRSSLVEKTLRLEGKPFSLSQGYDIYKAVYDVYTPTLLLKNARQTGKTQTISNFIALDIFSTPFVKALYLAPLESQTTRFSHTKLMKVINGSPLLRPFFTSRAVNNVFLKIATNGAETTLSYASDDPDRIRGISSDRNYYDEIQDMDLHSVMSVADSCMDASPDPRKIVSGTPKTMENPMEDLWMRSSQTEPLIRCDGCNCWNKPGLKNVGLKGFICSRCGKLLNVRNFIWKDFQADARIKGFHIPQIVLPIHTENEIKWSLLLERLETWPLSKFKNEVLAESDSVGTRLLTRDDLLSCCAPYQMSQTPNKSIAQDVDFVVAGVDWSGGGKEEVSRTVLHIWGVTPDLRFKTLFYKVYPVSDPVTNVADIEYLCQSFGVRMVIGDQGEGSLANGILASKLGQHRVGRFRYGSFSRPIEIDTVTGVYKLDKTTVIDNYFHFIKSRGTIFPCEMDSATAFNDILNEFSETTNTGKKVWKHSLSAPDDCLHAQIAGWIAGKLLKRDLTFI